MLGMRLTNGRCRGGVVVDKFDIDGSDVVFCTNFDTIYDQNYTMVNHMGDTLVDATGNGNNGTATGTSVVNTNFGKARNFNGSSDFIQLGNVGNADFMTLTALYKRTLDNTADQFILGKGFTSSANPYYQYALEDTWAPTRYYETYFSIGGVASALTSTPTQAIVNQFHTMTGKFDGAQVSLDVDETWWRVSKTGVVSQYATNATIGRNPLSASAYFGGIINEIRMATIARSDAWIKAESLALNDTLLTFADAE
jgi:hypothetical protein